MGGLVDERRLERTAYHEAGHAVAAVVLGRPFVYVTIEPDEDEEGRALGHVKYGRPRLDERDDAALKAGAISPGLRDRAERCVMGLFAGRVAEEGRWSDYDPVGWADEREVAFEGLIDLNNGDPELAEAHEKWLLLRTKRMIGNRAEWAAVEGLAAELLRRPRLTYRQALHVIRRARLAYFDAELARVRA